VPLALEGRRRWLIMPVLALGVSLIVIDGTIVNVALPEIIDALQMDLSEAEWTNSLYALVFAALLIAVGATADRFGRRRLFTIGVVVFALASVLAALSQSAEMLLAARALQGVGGAMVLPTSLSLVNANFHGRDRAAAFGIWGATIAGMAAVGPVLGGWLTTDFSWRLIFWINPPLALLVIIGTVLLVPESKEPGAPGLRDWFGVLLISAGLALFIFGLIEGETYGWWTASADAPGWWPLPGSPVPWALAAGVLLLAAFVGWTHARARRGKATLVDLSLFRLPTFRWGGVTILIVSLGEFGVIFVIPLFLQNVLGMSWRRACRPGCSWPRWRCTDWAWDLPPRSSPTWRWRTCPWPSLVRRAPCSRRCGRWARRWARPCWAWRWPWPSHRRWPHRWRPRGCPPRRPRRSPWR
jgi:EmrB/QacA subfamily drug resistance transporter